MVLQTRNLKGLQYTQVNHTQMIAPSKPGPIRKTKGQIEIHLDQCSQYILRRLANLFGDPMDATLCQVCEGVTSSPKTVPGAVRESTRAAGPERILSDESETTLSGSDHSEVASC